MNSDRIVITGASGVLGWHLCRYFAQRGFQVEGTYRRNRPDLKSVLFQRVRLEEADQVRQFSNRVRCRAVVHAAAMTHPDQCQQAPDLTRAVNVQGTLCLVEGLPPETRFIYISTDLVFDGLQGNYSERHETNPPNCYAQSKKMAEDVVLAHPNGVVVRLAKLYATGSPFHPCFVSWMRALFEKKRKVPLFHDQYRSPVYVGDVARVLERVIEGSCSHNLYHLGGPERLSRSRFGELYAEIFGCDRSLISPVSFDQAGLVTRGKDCSLNSSRMVEEFGLQPEPVVEGLKRMKADLY